MWGLTSGQLASGACTQALHGAPPRTEGSGYWPSKWSWVQPWRGPGWCPHRAQDAKEELVSRKPSRRAERLKCEPQGLSEDRGALKSQNPIQRKERHPSSSAGHLGASASQSSLVPLGWAASLSLP